MERTQMRPEDALFHLLEELRQQLEARWILALRDNRSQQAQERTDRGCIITTELDH